MACIGHDHPRVSAKTGTGITGGAITVLPHPRYGFVAEVCLSGSTDLLPIVVPWDPVVEQRIQTFEDPSKGEERLIAWLWLDEWLEKVRQGQLPRISHEEMCREIAC